MRVLIASGGSGGHVFPAVSLAKELRKDNAEIVFVASRRSIDRRLLQNETGKKIFLSVNPMPHKFGYRTFAFLFKLFFDSFLALFILIRHRPNAVVGFGGYTAGPIVFLAGILGMKTVIHEQNLVPGRTNKFLDRFVDKVAVSFSGTKKYFRNKNLVMTGNPLRVESLKNVGHAARKMLGLEEDKSTILIMGGSQGASSLNDIVSKSLCLLPRDKKEKMQVIHIAGTKNADTVKRRYNGNGIRAKVFKFIRNINEAYSACDLAVSRSGAAAIFELAAFKKPMILIPYPHEKNNQRFNARFFAEKGAAVYMDEKGLREKEVKDVIVELMDNPDRRSSLSENAGRLSIIDGAKRLKGLVMNDKFQITNK